MQKRFRKRYYELLKAFYQKLKMWKNSKLIEIKYKQLLKSIQKLINKSTI